MVSFGKMEKDFKQHIKLKSNIAKATTLLPVESYKRKRQEIANLPPLMEYNTSKQRSPSSSVKARVWQPPADFDQLLYEDP